MANKPVKPPLIPSLLYTEGSEKVKQEVKDELNVPDPPPAEAQAAVAAATEQEERKPTSE